jgi:alkaline phosphatase D
MPESSLGLPTFSRRRFLAHGAALGGGALVAGVPALVRSARPELTHGVQSGDVSGRAAVVWARANRTSRMLLDVDTSDSFRNARRLRGPVARRASDFTAQLELEDLPRGEEVFFRVRFVDLDDDRVASEARVGRFRTAPSAARPRDVSFVWSGDTAGQGWGMNPDFGGMRLYETMRSVAPDFFVHSGDTIYLRGQPHRGDGSAAGGGVWRNITTPEKSKVAETLDEFRANYKYNLLDTNLLRFNSEVPTFAEWDDHETVNNWYPGEVLDDRATPSPTSTGSPRERGRPSSSTCPCASDRATGTASTERFAPAPRWRSSSSTCVLTGGPTRTTTRGGAAMSPTFSTRLSFAGSARRC